MQSLLVILYHNLLDARRLNPLTERCSLCKVACSVFVSRTFVSVALLPDLIFGCC